MTQLRVLRIGFWRRPLPRAIGNGIAAHWVCGSIDVGQGKRQGRCDDEGCSGRDHFAGSEG